MIQAIYKHLSSDTELKSLLGMTDNVFKIHYISSQYDKSNYPFIVYQVSPYLAGGLTDQYKLEIRICVKDELLLESITKKVMDLLHFRPYSKSFIVGDKTIYHSKHSGTGLIYDSDLKVFEQVLNFIIKSK
ncbi:hypothetical protein P9E34_14130 [Schinkia azotoformans]|uniref:hypothetical protein n=1 Tax=Schinkia azotoformans TaxID=1454 RepID=UPI002DBCEF7B|nr:hypothetical protein [Schinkia azotoformans]MEC1725852.1 hypothetical protein [Schinkia azotoformans]